MNRPFSKLLYALVHASLALASSAALAQSVNFPTRTVTLVAATTPGGSIDIVARMLAPELESIFKQAVVVENRPGAGAQVGAAYVAKANADGHTLLISTGVAFAPVFSKVPPVALRDLAPVSLVAEGPLVMVAPKDLPANNMSDLFVYVRANPGKLNHATIGLGSAIFLYFAWWKSKERLNMQEIAYPGPGPIQAALLRGDVQMAMFSTAVAKAYVDTGKGKVIGVTGKKRLKEFPEARTFDELGLLDIGGTMVGMHAPGATPAAIVNRINAATVQAGKSPEFFKRMEGINYQIVLSSPDELRQREEFDAKSGLEIARTANIKPE